MTRSFSSLIVATALLASPLSTLAAPKDPAVITVNGKSITRSQFETLVQLRTARGAPDTPELRTNVQNQLVALEVLSQEAKKRKLDKSPEMQTKIAILTKETLQQALLEDFVRANPISEAEVRAEYERASSQAPERLEYSVRHILLNTEEEAKAVIEKLGKGEKFADLAKQSKDAANAEKGGELGWAVPQSFVPAFAQAMTNLKKGERSTEPVKTNFGFHVIQVDDTRPLPFPDFEKVKPEIETVLTRKKVNEFVRALRDSAKVVTAP